MPRLYPTQFLQGGHPVICIFKKSTIVLNGETLSFIRLNMPWEKDGVPYHVHSSNVSKCLWTVHLEITLSLSYAHTLNNYLSHSRSFY